MLARREEDIITAGEGGFVSSLCYTSRRRVGYLRGLVRWPAPLVSPSVSFPSPQALPGFARQTAGQGSCSRVDFGFGVTVPVEEIMVVQSGLVCSEGRSLGRRGYPEIGIGSRRNVVY